MKLATFFAATLATAAAAHASGVVFNTPVTYTQPVTYAAGVTYLAPVTYSPSAAVTAQAVAAARPVVLDRLIVTPKGRYAEHEWKQHLAAKRASAQLYPVRSERRVEGRAGNRFLHIQLPLQ